MRLFAIAIALCAIGMTGSYAAHRPDTSDAVLADRVSGTPQKCIPRNDISHHHLYSDGRILYSTRGQNPDFLNKTGPGCGGVNPNSSIFYLAYSNPLIAVILSGRQNSSCQQNRVRRQLHAWEFRTLSEAETGAPLAIPGAKPALPM